jgi:hypothetical protein
MFGGQDTDGFTAGLLIEPASTPQWVRMFL